MGGGGVMRAATKVASFGINGGLRGAPSVPLAEQSIATTGRKASRPSNSIVSSVATDDGRSSSVLLSSQNGKMIDTSVQKPLWEIDDWEFAGDGEELIVDSTKTTPIPRVVFGEVPTLEEAKEATCELKDALEQVYFSSNSSGSSETKVCVTQETAVANPSVPKPALLAFRLLKESSAAQSVVASIASDKNVWDAVMQNEKVMEFFQSQQTSGILPHGMDLNDKESYADNEFNDQESVKNIDDGDDGKSSGSSESSFMGFVENVKLKVTEVVTNVSENVKLKVTEMVMNASNLIHSLFGGSVEGNDSVDGKDGTSRKSMDNGVAASLLGLAVMAIMVVVLKRG